LVWWGAVLAAFVSVDAAPAAGVVVDGQRQLEAAVQRLSSTGGTIRLRPGRYWEVSIGPRSSRPLRVLADGVSTRYLRLLGTRNVTIVGLRVGSGVGPASEVVVASSRSVALERVAVVGTGRSRIRVRLLSSSGVTIRNGRFRRCGEEDTCILLGQSRGVRLVGNTFGACHNCDCVRGRLGGPGLIIRDNNFSNVVRAHCAPGVLCNHQDHIQLQRGSDVLIERNRFGIYEHGAAQIYLSGPLNRVTVRNNVFRGSDPARPGYVAPVGITVGNLTEHQHPPHRVVIAHNTILSGAEHKRGSRSSIALTPLYSRVPPALRPVVVNNVLALLATPRWVCTPARASINNIVKEGQTCSSTDLLADPLIGPVWGEPTAASLTIDRGAPGWAVYDVNRVRRDALPDVGAYELIGT
jgi:hypothetical protein